jgi:hypothetical protein
LLARSLRPMHLFAGFSEGQLTESFVVQDFLVMHFLLS